MSPPRLVPLDGGSVKHGGRAKAPPTDPAEPVPPAGGSGDGDDDHDDHDRWVTNLVIASAVVVVIGLGIWLVDALLTQRRLDDCAAQGRRNCAGITVPGR